MFETHPGGPSSPNKGKGIHVNASYYPFNTATVWSLRPDFHCKKNLHLAAVGRTGGAHRDANFALHLAKEDLNLCNTAAHAFCGVKCGCGRHRHTLHQQQLSNSGSSCPSGAWEPRSLHCACQSRGQLQRGKFKNGIWRFKCNTVKYSTGGVAIGSNILQYLIKQVRFCTILSFSALLSV